MRRVVLASTSPYRHALLERLGISFEAMAPSGVDERAVEGLPPQSLSEHLARAKAEDVASRAPDAVIIGSDQVPALGERILHKPGNASAAIEQLRLLSGREHRLYTAVCVLDAATGEALTHVDVHKMRLRTLDDGEIVDYIARDAPFDCAGSYKVESLGIALMDTIAGKDFTAITGLPLMAVTRMLSQMGVRVLGA